MAGTVIVRYYRGIYVPCNSCQLRRTCAVPKKGKNLRNLKGAYSLTVYECEDYEHKGLA